MCYKPLQYGFWLQSANYFYKNEAKRMHHFPIQSGDWSANAMNDSDFRRRRRGRQSAACVSSVSAAAWTTVLARGRLPAKAFRDGVLWPGRRRAGSWRPTVPTFQSSCSCGSRSPCRKTKDVSGQVKLLRRCFLTSAFPGRSPRRSRWNVQPRPPHSSSKLCGTRWGGY